MESAAPKHSPSAQAPFQESAGDREDSGGNASVEVASSGRTRRKSERQRTDSSGPQDKGECGAECPEPLEMPKPEGSESGGGARQRHTPAPVDLSSVDDSARAPMSPNSFPSTPDKNNRNMSHTTPADSEGRAKTRESLKAQKKTYRSRKKEAAKELMSSITDPSVVLLGDWLKVRGTLKSWTKLWCVLKPGILILYKSDKHKGSQWVGTILLNTCQLLERPSKKDGFCFKLFHPLDQSIWATRGPKGETIGAFVQPLPYSYCIFRAPSESAGKCWMDALELALKCTNLLKRSMTRLDTSVDARDIHSSSFGNGEMHDGEGEAQYHSMRAQESKMNESDLEQHFANQGVWRMYQHGNINHNMSNELASLYTNNSGLDDDKSDRDDSDLSSQSEFEVDQPLPNPSAIPPPEETQYVENISEELGQQGDNSQTEEVTDENKSLIWTLVKQVRPGMDLSKVVLPTFILEPRSFLDKLSDYYYHADILSEAVTQESPYNRMKYVVRWYLSGFYKKPKGLKKPYNPVIGETFRCFWYHPRTGSRTFYIAEQVSHHPPISVFHVTNRKDGFNINGSILARSKFYGNSLSAILDGVATLTFLERGEDYFITMPYAHCKGILIGTLTMELGGKVTIECPKTGYKCELEFKLKPFLGSGQASNRIHGKITMGADTLAMLDGHWDQEIYIKDRTVRRRDVFWNPTPEVRSMRLKRYTVPIEEQCEFESERLWQKCSAAIVSGDMHAATKEKFTIEEQQRQAAKERKLSNTEWVPRFFEKDYLSNAEWIYKHADDRPWDSVNDVYQYEKDFVIQTQTRHKTPHLRALSINSLNKSVEKKKLHIPQTVDESDSSVGGGTTGHHRRESDSSDYIAPVGGDSGKRQKVVVSDQSLQTLLEPVIQMQQEMSLTLRNLQQQIARLQRENNDRAAEREGGLAKDWVTLAVILIFQLILQWLFSGRT